MLGRQPPQPQVTYAAKPHSTGQRFHTSLTRHVVVNVKSTIGYNP